MNILIIGAYPNSIVSFRGLLIRGWVEKGYKVTVMSANGDKHIINKVKALGAEFRPYNVQRNGLNPLADLKTLAELIKAFNECKPNKVLAYTIKPIIWGGIASNFYKKADFYGMVTGLGYAFEKGDAKRNIINKLVKGLYRFALRNAKGVIFQNTDNLHAFISHKLTSKSKAHRVHGSGVNLSEYKQTELPKGKTTFLLVARLLGDKGIREYAAAAKEVKQQYPETIFQLLGPEDSSPDRIHPNEITEWQTQGIIDYLGETDHVLPYIQKCHIFTLPSYHEGLPRSVLEAMSVGRPILTTNASGCRDTVIQSKNGQLVSPKNAQQLKNQMIWFIENPNLWESMAKESRNIVENHFDVYKVNKHINNIVFSYTD